MTTKIAPAYSSKDVFHENVTFMALYFRNRDMRLQTYVTVIPNEPCILQHQLLLCLVKWRGKVRKLMKTFVSKYRLRKLREAYHEIAFKRRVEVKEASRSEDSVEQI